MKGTLTVKHGEQQNDDLGVLTSCPNGKKLQYCELFNALSDKEE